MAGTERVLFRRRGLDRQQRQRTVNEARGSKSQEQPLRRQSARRKNGSHPGQHHLDRVSGHFKLRDIPRVKGGNSNAYFSPGINDATEPLERYSRPEVGRRAAVFVQIADYSWAIVNPNALNALQRIMTLGDKKPDETQQVDDGHCNGTYEHSVARCVSFARHGTCCHAQ